MSRLPLLIVLLINTAVTGTGWAMNTQATAPEQPAAEHAHCGDAMEQMAETESVPHQHTNGCCTPGACHCAPPSPASDLAVVPLRAPLVRVASSSPHDNGALPAPDLSRLLRPPIA
jgi:hypothetical protein